MTPFDALSEMPNLVADYKAATSRLIEAERELASKKNDKYVSIEWVAELWSVDTDTARKMIQTLAQPGPGKGTNQLKVLSYGSKIVRYRRADIERITEASLVSIKDMLTQKRAARNTRRS